MTFQRSLSIGIALGLLGSAALLASGVRLLAQSGTGAEEKSAIRRPEPPKAESTTPAPSKKPTVAPPSTPTATTTESPVTKATASDEEAAALAEAKAAEAERMNELFPIGRIFEGVKIPSYSGDTLSSVVHAQFMRRADDEHLEMEMLEIVNYNAGEPDSRILTDRAIYDLEAKTMRSTTPAKIIQSQFEMRGDRLIFDNESRIGHMIGNVKTRIHQVDKFTGSDK